MKSYTSEAVYLLTTLVNMVRARSCDSHTGSCDPEAEKAFINTVSLEIFEVWTNRQYRNRLVQY